MRMRAVLQFARPEQLARGPKVKTSQNKSIKVAVAAASGAAAVRQISNYGNVKVKVCCGVQRCDNVGRLTHAYLIAVVPLPHGV